MTSTNPDHADPAANAANAQSPVIEPPEPGEAQRAIDHYSPEALAIPPDQLRTCGDPELAMYNIRVGLLAIVPHAAALKKALPEIDHAKVQQLPMLAAAVWVAAGRVGHVALPASEIAALRARVSDHREGLLPVAEGLATKNLLPGPAVAAIRKGRGAFDSAQDVIMLAELYRAAWKDLHDKVPFSADDLTAAAADGLQLAQVLRPGQGVDGTPAPTARDGARQLRDGLWTLLRQLHRDLRRCGMYIWVDDVDDHVPALQARKR